MTTANGPQEEKKTTMKFLMQNSIKNYEACRSTAGSGLVPSLSYGSSTDYVSSTPFGEVDKDVEKESREEAPFENKKNKFKDYMQNKQQQQQQTATISVTASQEPLFQ